MKAGARTPWRDAVWDRLAEGIEFVQGDFSDDAAFDNLAAVTARLDEQRGTSGNWAFYLSVPPQHFSSVIHQLQRSGMARSDNGWRRVVIEKPFGHDEASARRSTTSSTSLPESAVFRIDHYLGKETVQNILARFASQLSTRCSTPTTSTTCRSRWPRTLG